MYGVIPGGPSALQSNESRQTILQSAASSFYGAPTPPPPGAASTIPVGPMLVQGAQKGAAVPGGPEWLAANSYNTVQEAKRDIAAAGEAASTYTRKCSVLPPLLLSHEYNKVPGDQFVPMTVLPGGHIRYVSPNISQGAKPPNIDFVINFMHHTKAVTITLCSVDPKKLRDLETVVSTLYSLVSQSPVDFRWIMINYHLLLKQQRSSTALPKK